MPESTGLKYENIDRAGSKALTKNTAPPNSKDVRVSRALKRLDEFVASRKEQTGPKIDQSALGLRRLDNINYLDAAAKLKVKPE